MKKTILFLTFLLSLATQAVQLPQGCESAVGTALAPNLNLFKTLSVSRARVVSKSAPDSKLYTLAVYDTYGIFSTAQVLVGHDWLSGNCVAYGVKTDVENIDEVCSEEVTAKLDQLRSESGIDTFKKLVSVKPAIISKSAPKASTSYFVAVDADENVKIVKVNSAMHWLTRQCLVNVSVE